ncbi:MAG: hypothetical protein QXT16_08520 [Candidatus Caldarchaeum sp.]
MPGYKAQVGRLKAAAKRKGVIVEEYEVKRFISGPTPVTWRHYRLKGVAASLDVEVEEEIGWAALSFHDGTVKMSFFIERAPLHRLLRILCGELSGEEVEMLKGISLMWSINARSKLMRLFLEGSLDLATVARTLFRNLAYAKRRGYILAVSEWLSRNGFKHMAREAVIMKTLF